MIRWRRFVGRLPEALRPTGVGRRYAPSVDETCLRHNASPVASQRWFSAAGARHSAVTSAAFAECLRAVGVSSETLHELYEPKSDHASTRQDRWVARLRSSFPIAVALSGGADSMALMLLLKEFLDAQRVDTPLLAITVDHRLRAESGDEARYVGGIASRDWGVRHVTMECDWQSGDDRNGAPRKSKLQEEARAYRYELLAEACLQHGVKCLFVAHNLGDQLETMLFRLGRASGINGLAGMAARTNLVSDEGANGSGVALLRPLLGVSKPSLRATCERFDQLWVEDPSNESLVFDRIRIRKALELIEHSATGAQDMNDLIAFQRIAATAREEFDARENELLHRYTTRIDPDHVILSSAILFDPRCFDELAIRLLSKLVRKIGEKDAPPRLSSLEGLLRDLRVLGSGKKVTLSGCCITKKQRGSELHFQPERPTSLRGRKATVLHIDT